MILDIAHHMSFLQPLHFGNWFYFRILATEHDTELILLERAVATLNRGLAEYILNNAVFWDEAPCSFYVNRRFGGCSLQPTAHAGSSLANFPPLKTEEIQSS
jgi:hypothetical protein